MARKMKCVVCGKPFTTSHSRQMTCSKECSHIKKNEYGRERQREIRSQKREEEKEQLHSLCWECGKAINSGCSWSKCFEPVEGWTAKARGGRESKAKSYKVLECPEYVKG